MEQVGKLIKELAGTEKRVLVTGARGFVGSKVIQRLAANGIPVLGIDLTKEHKFDYYSPLIETDVCDITKKDNLKFLFSKYDIEYVIHTAALFKFSAPYEHLKLVNVDGTYNLLEAASHAGKIKALVHYSTAMVYGPTKIGRPCREDDPMSPANEYAKTKYESELVIKEFKDDFKIITVRPTAIYGRGSMYGLKKVADFFSHDYPVLPMPFKGNIKSSVVHVRDVAGATLHLLANYENLKYDEYNIADELPVTIREAFEFIKEKTLSKTILIPLPDTVSSMMRKFVDYLPLTVEIPVPHPFNLQTINSLERDDLTSLVYENYFDITRLKESGYELIYPTFFKGFSATLSHFVAMGELPQKTIDRIKASMQ